MTDTLQTKTQGATDQAKSVASDAQAKVQEKAQDAQAMVQDRAQQAKSTVMDRAREQADTRSTQVGESMTGIADIVRRTSGELRDQGKHQPADMADQAADRVEQLGGYLTNTRGDQLLRDVEDLARRQPMAVAAAGLMLGFVASRFVRASSTTRYGSDRSSYAQTGYGSSGYRGSSYGSTGPVGGVDVPSNQGNQAWLEERAATHSHGADLPQQVR